MLRGAFSFVLKCTQIVKTSKSDDAMPNNVLLVLHDQQPPGLYNKLQRGYNVFAVRNWEKAKQVIETTYIQLIISSLECCVRLKSSPRFAHIPVIVLADDDSLQAKLKSLEAGADAYIGHAVPWIYLDAQIRNLVINRTKITGHFAAVPDTGGDGDFIKTLNDHITANIHSHLLNVDLLARLMNMSRPTLYRKIKTITDLTPNELINLTRLKKAADRLASGNYKVYEIAKMAGFQSQSSFGKAFIKQFKVSPTQYVKMKKKSSVHSRSRLAEKYYMI